MQTCNDADHQQLSVCMSRRKCGNCRKLLVGCKQQQEHQCGYVRCPSCHHYVEALSHRCFIQVAKTPEEEWAERRAKRRPGRRLRGAAAGLATVHSNEDDVPSTSLLPYLLWMVSTSMTKNLRYTYSPTWRSCRTRDVTFQISSTPFLINPTSDAFLTLPTSC